MSTYMCPKCFNTLPISNKILHDLKCTKESPVELSQENPYTSSVSNSYDYGGFGMRYSANDYSHLRISDNFNLSSELRNSAGSRYYKRMSFMNDDGTTTEYKKDTDMSGKEELLEITYDPQGNIIGRKKADGGRSSVKFNFHELQNYSSYDPMDNYNIYEGGSVYVQTIPTIEIIQPVETYTIDYVNVNSNPFGHDFGSRGYSLMESNIDNGQIVDSNTNDYTNNYTTNYQTNYTNQNTNQYSTDNTTISYSNQNNTIPSENYSYSNNYNYDNQNFDNYFQNTSTNNYTTSNNYSYQNNQTNDDLKCAKVTKLN